MDDRNWDEHWRVLFNKVTLDDIKNFEEKYKNSREDLICTQYFSDYVSIFVKNLKHLSHLN